MFYKTRLFSWHVYLFDCYSLLFFFCLDTKKETKKSQASNENGPLLASSFVELLCIVVSALVMLLLVLLQPTANISFFMALLLFCFSFIQKIYAGPDHT
jgi:hypothetical protein